MITPSFGLTATERVLPKLALDFTTASLDSRITFTRTTSASNPATYVNSSGVITAATNDQPRFDYHPVTLACKGLLIEEARTNAFQYSQDLDNGYWSKYLLSVAKDSALSPDGTTNAEKLTPSTANDGHALIRTGSTTGTTYTISFFAKPAGYDWVFFEEGSGGNQRRTWFNISTGAVGTKNANHTASILLAPNGYYRCSVTYTAATTGSFVFCPSPSDNTNVYAGNGSSGIYLWGLQNETGAFATSYIPTTSAALTRNADVATMTGTNFSSWFNASEGTFVAEASYSANSANCVYINDGTTSNRILMYFGSSAQGLVTTSGVAQASLDGGTPVVGGTLNTVCLSYKLDSFRLALQGGSTVADTSGTIPTVSQLNIGAGPGGQLPLNGVITGFNYYPLQLTSNEVQAFSK